MWKESVSLFKALLLRDLINMVICVFRGDGAEKVGPIGKAVLLDSAVLGLSVVLIAFKIAGVDMSWYQVLNPIWGSIVIEFVLGSLVLAIPALRYKAFGELQAAYGEFLPQNY